MEAALEREGRHRKRAGDLAGQVRAARGRGAKVRLGKSTSNLFRKRTDGARSRLDVRDLRHVLRIDRERLTADVEGMTTYGELVEETLRYGLLPAVVPELKTITVGGAVTGLGIESSSFRYGLVHETVEAMEILTGEGEIVPCSSESNSDLFFGFPNSYGTLGYALRVTVRLIPAEPFVHLTHTRFAEAAEFFRALGSGGAGEAADYVDGTVFAPGEVYVTRGVFAREAGRVSDYRHRKIYYHSIREKDQDWLTAKDYIWRWDTDWFWCSRHFGAEHPAVRLLAAPMLHSGTYQRLMRLSHKLLPDSGQVESVIQDVQIPAGRAVEFLDFLFREVGITPIWTCPFRTTSRRYPLCRLEPESEYVNFGFWDMAPAGPERGHYTKRIERKAAELGGTKALYSRSYYDRETFWAMHGKSAYDRLKARYDPDGVFPGLYEKCVEGR